MNKMTSEEIREHKENPNVLLKLKGQSSGFRCRCGCNVFHHIDDWDIFFCNACDTEYETS